MADLALTVTERQELTDHEAVIERGLKTFVDVGSALLSIRDGRLYRAEYGTFEAYCLERWGLERRRAYQLMDAAGVASNVKNFSHLPERESHAAPLAKLDPEQQREAWASVVQEAEETGERITGAKVQGVVNRIVQNDNDVELDFDDDRGCWNCKWEREAAHDSFCDSIGVIVDGAGVIAFRCITNGRWEKIENEPDPENKPHVSNNSGNNEWYTPAKYIEAAQRVMGGIDCDPASSEIANETVQATTFYTAETDGLCQEWRGRLWLNPPYSQPLIAQFAKKLSEHVNRGDVPEACVLVNNATETGWFNDLFSVASSVCFVRRRIKFVDKDGIPGGAPLQGQAILYIGLNTERFCQTFKEFGTICEVKFTTENGQSNSETFQGYDSEKSHQQMLMV